MALVELLMASRVTTLLRESRGLVTDDGGGIVEKQHLEALRMRKLWFCREPQDSVDTVLIVCDPNGSHSPTSSEMALVALCRPRAMPKSGYVVRRRLSIFFLPFF